MSKYFFYNSISQQTYQVVWLSTCLFLKKKIILLELELQLVLKKKKLFLTVNVNNVLQKKTGIVYFFK